MPSYSIGQAAALLCVSPETVRRWADAGRLPSLRAPDGTRSVDGAALAAFATTFDCATNGPQHHVFEGALLRDVVAGAGPVFDARRRKDRSRYLLAVSGGDGHHTVLSWAELDADFCGSPVLLATRLDGEELDVPGSQLVVPSDRCGARYVSAVTHVWFGTLSVPALTAV
ncbi:helix-turn-helix domain-containing protein [Streptomyces sp. NPDC047976]|uniref:helix-turn-helix domain-containing protein n=1 Tax=Streptomyces sp. NPDC047976 TaxID=3155746 RepID=UPI003443B55B